MTMVVSQDKQVFIEATGFYVLKNEYPTVNENVYEIMGLCEGTKWKLGKYKTLEHALKIMNELQIGPAIKSNKSLEQRRAIYQMPEEEKQGGNLMNQNRIDFLEGKIEKRRTWISNAEDFILDAEDSIEELQQNIEGWREYVGDKENQINELESELEVLREEQQKRSQGVQDAEDRGWHSMKL